MCLVKEKIEKLGIPIVFGRIGGNGGTFIVIEKADFDAYKDILGEGSICVIDTKTVEADDGRILIDGFDAQVRLRTSNTWICARFENPESIEDGEIDGYDFGDTAPSPTIDYHAINRVAIAIAKSDGFGGVVRNRELRFSFSQPIALEAHPEWGDGMIQAAAQTAVNFWEYGVIPMRAKALKADGKSINDIAKLLGITKQRAERSIGMNDQQSMIEMMHKYESETESANLHPPTSS